MHGQQHGHLGLSRRTTAAYLALCICTFVLFAPGRIVFPDDEIVYQTTASLWERGDLSVTGIPKRTGEPKGRPSGTFGWATGTDGKRYGFFGHALSVVALPAYGMAKASAPSVPASWRHAIRSDHFFVHKRSHAGDWSRLCVSLTNCVVTALAGWLLMVWARQLGVTAAGALVTGLAYAFGTLALPYTRTFLSEPLSAVLLLAGAIGVTRFHAARRDNPRAAARWLWAAAIVVGVSIHTHVLNLVAVPCFVGFAMLPLRGDGGLGPYRRAWGGALLIGAAAVALLGWSHYARFGDPFETGRHGLYSHFILPGMSLVALLIAPGRSFLLLSPALLVALRGWPALLRRARPAAIFAIAVVLTRVVFVSARSDWWGGWAIGPRFLVPAIPFALLPLAVLWDRLQTHRARGLVLLSLAACVALQVHLALHSIFEWMVRVHQRTPNSKAYLDLSHWDPSASPVVGFFQLSPDVLWIGAVRLAQHGHGSFVWMFVPVALVAVAAAGWLVREFVLRRRA